MVGQSIRRCRSLHRKCSLRSGGGPCSNCEAAGTACKDGGKNELKIRFSKLSHQPAPESKLGSSSSQVEKTGNEVEHHERIPSPRQNSIDSSTTSGVNHEDVQQVNHNTVAHDQPSAPLGGVFISRISPWPLTNDESKLLKHFFTVLIPWFDYCWLRGPFRSYLQQAIGHDAGILYAILAVSARHIEAVRQNNCNSDEYERRCLGILIPMLNDEHTAETEDDMVLVSALLLRLLDEMTDPTDSQFGRRHTVSAPLLLRMRQHSIEPSELNNACMAIVLRQEIHVANLTKRPVELDGADCGISDSLEPASDITWTWRIMSHTAKATNYAYGGEPRSETRWDELWGYLEEWSSRKPASLDVLNVIDDTIAHDARPFPELFFVNECAIASRQYAEICKIILLGHDPRRPALGLGRTRYLRTQENRIREAVRTTCGICLSNPEYAPTKVLAALSIAIAGELFTDPIETSQFLDIIAEAEMHVGWPCLKVSPYLKDFWDPQNAVA